MENNTQESKKKKSILNSNLFRLFIALLVLCGCAGLGAGIAVLEDKSDPTEYVAEYFGKFLIQDYESMYEYVDLDGAFAPKTTFVKFMENLRVEHNVGEYEFGELKNKGDRYLMQINYKDGETGEDKEFDVYLIKHRENWKQLVADWKISIDEYMVTNYMLEMPKGMKPEIDGVVVDESLMSTGEYTGDVIELGDGETIAITPVGEAEEESNTQTFRIHKMLRGIYKGRALTDYTQIAKELPIIFNEQQEVMNEADIKVRDEYISLIEANSPAMIQEFYSVVRNKKSSGEELLKYFVADENVVKELKKVAKKNQEVIFWPEVENIDEYKLQQCNFSELQYTAEYAGENNLRVVYTFSYEYLLSTETELYSSYVETLSGNCDVTMEITYTVADGQIKVSGLSVKNKNNKSIEEAE